MTLSTPLLVTFIIYIAGMLLIRFFCLASHPELRRLYSGGTPFGQSGDRAICGSVRYEWLVIDGAARCYLSLWNF